jgi:cytochrome c nitrite reductase small subunit
MAVIYRDNQTGQLLKVAQAMRQVAVKRVRKAGKIKVRYLGLICAGFVLAIVCYFAVNAIMEPFSSSAYCATCHEMETVYEGWKQSGHYVNVSGTVTECIDCHLPPKDQFFRHMSVKAYEGLRDVVIHWLGRPYDEEKMRERTLWKMPDSRCTRCHSNLLGKPSTPAVAVMHTPSTEPNAPTCVDCHNDMHPRPDSSIKKDPADEQTDPNTEQ